MGTGIAYFLDLPVYRLAEDHYVADQNAHIDAVMTEHPLPDTPEHPCTATDLSEPDSAMRDHLWTSYGGAWRYNEIIGYIRLHFVGTQVRGEYWRVGTKRIVRTRKKVFEWRNWKLAPETDIPVEADSAEIFRLVLEQVAQCRSELNGRFVDTESLETLGPYLNWRALLDEA